MDNTIHPRAEQVAEIIERHAEAKGADEQGTAWAQRSARSSLAAGLHESEAILAAFEELRLWIEYMERIDYGVADACIQHAVRDTRMEAT